jgi:hypothetical protein
MAQRLALMVISGPGIIPELAPHRDNNRGNIRPKTLADRPFETVRVPRVEPESPYFAPASTGLAS